MSGNQVNVYLGKSSAPEVEADILDRVGTYGKQLGQLTDAVIVLLRRLPDRTSLPPEERDALAKFEAMAADVETIKEKHKRPALAHEPARPHARRATSRPRHRQRRASGLALPRILHRRHPQPEHPPGLCARRARFLAWCASAASRRSRTSTRCMSRPTSRSSARRTLPRP